MALEEYGAMKIHTPIISFLLGVGLFANIVFLMSLKADNSKLSYSEKIQVYKTSLVIMAMMIELSLIQTKNVSMVACIVKGTSYSQWFFVCLCLLLFLRVRVSSERYVIFLMFLSVFIVISLFVSVFCIFCVSNISAIINAIFFFIYGTNI
jgi:hypothetical protein